MGASRGEELCEGASGINIQQLKDDAPEAKWKKLKRPEGEQKKRMGGDRSAKLHHSFPALIGSAGDIQEREGWGLYGVSDPPDTLSLP